MEDLRSVFAGRFDKERLKVICLDCGEHTYREYTDDDGTVMILPRACACRRERAAEIARQKRIEELAVIRDRCLPSEYAKRCRFETSEETKLLLSLKRYVDAWERGAKDQVGLLLWGDVDTGKSHAAYCIANALIEKDVSVYATQISTLADSQFLDAYNATRIMDRVKGCDLLILDDLGTERETEFMTQKAFDFVNARVETGKPMIITTNLSPDVMANALDVNKKRLYSRIIGATTALEVRGKSRRAEKSRRGAEELFAIINEGGR